MVSPRGRSSKNRITVSHPSFFTCSFQPRERECPAVRAPPAPTIYMYMYMYAYAYASEDHADNNQYADDAGRCDEHQHGPFLWLPAPHSLLLLLREAVLAVPAAIRLRLVDLEDTEALCII